MNPTSERAPVARVWGVAGLVRAIGDALQARFGVVRVSGELSACTEAASGHLYFSLKDTQAQAALLRCAMFRRAAAGLGFAPREGLRVEAVGRLALYEPRGDLQFIVESLELVGTGSLYEEFLRLKTRLAAEGLFDPAHKQALPEHPRVLAVVSSLQAAALRDVLTAVSRRAPQVSVIVVPCLVQGADAPETIVSALQSAAKLPDVDAVILTRGGGSLEDLWAFNDERVVRAVHACVLPLVCGVGHETDFTLADFAADVRAATPTAAAELLTPLQSEELRGLSVTARRLMLAVQHQLDAHAQRLDQLSLSVRRPAQGLALQQRTLQALQGRLAAAVRVPVGQQTVALQRRAARLMAVQAARMAQEQSHCRHLGARIEAQDPRLVLQRGYAWVSNSAGRPLTSATQARAGDTLTAVWHDGQAEVRVEHVQAPPAAPIPRDP